MKSSELWTLFEETGAPEVYLMYTNARKMETVDAFNDSGSSCTSCQL